MEIVDYEVVEAGISELDDESVFAADKLRQMIGNLLKEMVSEEEK